jgi:hypothetical protein
MKRFLPLLLLSTLTAQLFGCEELGVKTTPIPFDTADTNSDIPLEDFVVIDIDPNFGSPAGGTSVSISGNGFEGDVAVSFGNLELDITVIDAQTIVLETPSSPSEGQVDVTIESDIGSVTIDDGFNYTNDAPDTEDTDTQDTEDTQSTDTGTPQSTGLTGGLVEIWRRLYACPDCFNPAFPQQVIEASASIHDPVQGSWISWLPPLNSCESVLTYPNLGASLDLGQVSLTGNGTAINLSFDSQSGSYINSNVPTTSFQYNTVYGLQSNLVSFQSLLQTPSTPEVIEPAGMLDTQGFVQPFSKSNFAIFWGPTGTTDTILFLLEVYGQNGSYNTVTCLTTDSGGLGLDPALLSSFSAQDMLVVSLYRMQLTGAIHPDNGSTIEAVSAVGVIGTGYLVE